jgi:hypothetical protein
VTQPLLDLATSCRGLRVELRISHPRAENPLAGLVELLGKIPTWRMLESVSQARCKQVIGDTVVFADIEEHGCPRPKRRVAGVASSCSGRSLAVMTELQSSCRCSPVMRQELRIPLSARLQSAPKFRSNVRTSSAARRGTAPAPVHRSSSGPFSLASRRLPQPAADSRSTPLGVELERGWVTRECQSVRVACGDARCRLRQEASMLCCSLLGLVARRRDCAPRDGFRAARPC